MLSCFFRKAQWNEMKWIIHSSFYVIVDIPFFGILVLHYQAPMFTVRLLQERISKNRNILPVVPNSIKCGRIPYHTQAILKYTSFMRGNSLQLCFINKILVSGIATRQVDFIFIAYRFCNTVWVGFVRNTLKDNILLNYVWLGIGLFRICEA